MTYEERIAKAFEQGFQSYKGSPYRIARVVWCALEESGELKRMDPSLLEQWMSKVYDTLWTPLAVDKVPEFDPATTAVYLWGSSARTNLVTSRDFKEIYELGEQAASHLYELCFRHGKRFPYYPPKDAQIVSCGCGLSIADPMDVAQQVVCVSWQVVSLWPLDGLGNLVETQTTANPPSSP